MPVLPDVPLPPLATSCALLLPHLPLDAAFSRWTALRLRGAALPERWSDDCALHVAVPPGTRIPRRRGVAAHTSSALLEPDAAATHLGLPVVTAAHAWAQLAPVLGERDLLELADALTAHRVAVTTRDELGGAVASMPTGSRGRRTAAAVARSVLPGTCCPLQAATHRALHLGTLPRLRDLTHRAAFGRQAGPLLGYPEHRLVLDCDAPQHALEGRSALHVRTRRERLVEEGWVVLTVLPEDLHHHALRLRHRVRRALALATRATPGS
ncbi:hypothetical protein [Cellulomonas marina]|uniref:DUF559 domain-containing protein n=1 Tax=Cellulomonas marina TaxID=988821 RepID=A0A1I0WT19_9CELL|nr:hypothetical protein [Cellulomonas marina]GIG27820.1 hypothetical protein Cma02nite_04200 [Cellulomonas marina]SFA91093.1 hypothetical protein SAMN05421867_103169 [Cellulomonas marina]